MNILEPKTRDPVQVNIGMKTPSQKPPASSKAPNQDLKDMDILCTFKIKIKTQNLDHGVSNTSDHIQINIRMQNPSQKPPASSKAPNQALNVMDVICTFKIKIESQNLAYGVPKTSDHIQINIRMQNPSQEPPASSKTPNQDIKDMYVFCACIIKTESGNLEHWRVINQ